MYDESKPRLCALRLPPSSPDQTSKVDPVKPSEEAFEVSRVRQSVLPDEFILDVLYKTFANSVKSSAVGILLTPPHCFTAPAQ